MAAQSAYRSDTPPSGWPARPPAMPKTMPARARSAAGEHHFVQATFRDLVQARSTNTYQRSASPACSPTTWPASTGSSGVDPSPQAPPLAARARVWDRALQKLSDRGVELQVPLASLQQEGPARQHEVRIGQSAPGIVGDCGAVLARTLRCEAQAAEKRGSGQCRSQNRQRSAGQKAAPVPPRSAQRCGPRPSDRAAPPDHSPEQRPAPALARHRPRAAAATAPAATAGQAPPQPRPALLQPRGDHSRTHRCTRTWGASD